MHASAQRWRTVHAVKCALKPAMHAGVTDMITAVTYTDTKINAAEYVIYQNVNETSIDHCHSLCEAQYGESGYEAVNLLRNVNQCWCITEVNGTAIVEEGVNSQLAC